MKRNTSPRSKPLVVALLSCAVFGSVATYAAESQSYTISLTAEIPSDNFQVIPVDTGWINQTQDMEYNITSSQLQVFEKQFQYKNTAGAIQATLTENLNSNGKPQLSNGKDVIPLTVSFNNIELSKTAVTVVDDAAAKAGGRAALKISQADRKALDVSGSFTGNVSMLFEPVPAHS